MSEFLGNFRVPSEQSNFDKTEEYEKMDDEQLKLEVSKVQKEIDEVYESY